MNFGVKKKEEQDVNITPLIDVVFILLIFFMVTTTFQRESRLAVNLPQASETPQAQQDVPLEIVINPAGAYFINGQELPDRHAHTLKNALKEFSRGKKDQPLVIRADANTPHQAVVTALDSAAQLGLVRISIATTEAE